MTTGTTTYAANNDLSEDCKKQMQETREEYGKLVMSDLLHSFHLFDENNEEDYIYFTAKDLWKNQLLIGDNKLFESLKNQMSGSYRGEKRMYIRKSDPNTSYILFRNVNSENVMVTLVRNGEEWVQVEKKIKQGKKFGVKEIKCGDEHFMQKMFDNLYP
ncbi:hypothetical protein SM124_19215 [Bacillus sp. 31A1R]|uniref:Uncharacterized protein n=2 Tax=Robertmurraya mangrovi TaxID=3098077 RepID=A0ABU5J367_9BACI|nr:hypothetical protein [Bacillus sp. 31A1R]